MVLEKQTRLLQRVLQIVGIGGLHVKGDKKLHKVFFHRELGQCIGANAILWGRAREILCRRCFGQEKVVHCRVVEHWERNEQNKPRPSGAL